MALKRLEPCAGKLACTVLRGANCSNAVCLLGDELYFKVDVKLAEEYKNAGSFPFTYKRDDKTIALSYWYVPSEIIEDRDLLKEWFNKSLGVAISQNIGKQEDQKIK